MKKLWLWLVVPGSLLHAQSGGVRLRLLEDRVYYERELIQVEMTETGSGWQFAGFLVDPPQECGTVAKPCFLSDIAMMNGPMGVRARSESSVIAINHYVPKLPPGRYRVTAVARRVGHDMEAAGDPIRFEIVPATAAWLKDIIGKCAATSRGLQPRTESEDGAWSAAAEQLAWLDTPASRDTVLELLSRREPILLAGLRASRDPAHVCARMQARVPAPDQWVSSNYLYSMTEICAKANLPPAPVRVGGHWFATGVISATPPNAARAISPDPAMQAWLEKRRDYTEDLWNKATAALAASLSAKQPETRWEAFGTLLQRINQVRSTRPPQPDPAWIPALTAEFVGSFGTVDAARQRYLLEMFTSTVRSPAVVPLLESVLDSWKPGDYYEAVQSAIRALNAIDPARAQARIRAELTRPQTWLDVPQLEMLPSSAVPPMDDALIEALAAAQRPPGWNPNLRMAALARYGTAKALSRMKAIYQSQEVGCQPELVAYFVRVDPAYADRILHAQPWDMHAPPPVCVVQYFLRTAPLAMSPGLEQYMAAYLMHSDVYVKTTAAQALGRYGTPAALPKLWDTLRYFHDWWKGRDAELKRNGQGIALEVELRNAIARGRGWLATDTDLRLIESLCSSDWCHGETQVDLREWSGPLRIQLQEGQNRVAQYGGLESIAALEAKLKQFPRGTNFVISGGGPDAAEIGRFLSGR